MRHGPNPTTALFALAAAASLAACTPLNRSPEPTLVTDLNQLEETIDLLPSFPEPLPASGSLWSEAGPGMALVRDTRAFRVNDLVTIRLTEQDSGTNSSGTDLERSSEADFGVGTALGFEQTNPVPGRFSLNQFLQTSSSSAFAGDGSTTRGNTLSATITARVARVLPNGDLVIAGQKNVMVNRERQVLTLVGSIRAVDIDAGNFVSSAKVGDLTVRLWGRGEVDATVQQGWFMRVVHRLWPF